MVGVGSMHRCCGVGGGWVMSNRWKKVKEAVVGKKIEEMTLYDVIEEHYHPPLWVELKEFFKDSQVLWLILGVIYIPLFVLWLVGVV